MPLDDALLAAIDAGHRCIRLVTSEEDEVYSVVVSAAMARGRNIRVWSSVRGVYDGLAGTTADVPQTENPAAGLFQLSRELGGANPAGVVLVTLDLVPHLREDARTIRAWRDLLSSCGAAGSCLVMIDHDDQPPPIVRLSSQALEVPLPDPERIEAILRNTLRTLHRDKPIEADLSRSELSSILRNLRGLTSRQVAQVIRDATIPDRRLSIEDLATILLAKRKLIETEGVLEFVESPESLDQIGGLARLKDWLRRREVGLRDGASEHGLTPPRGVLLLGVQGSGKSLAAKAIGTAWGRPILRLDAGALYDRYVGESERRLRDALRQAEMMAPVVLWIDEIEKAFASAASTSTDGGLSRRMFGTLLTWMQEHREPVFLAATANDIEALPPELLRKGRFDEIFFVDLPGEEARRAIFQIHLRRRKQAIAGFDLDTLARRSDGFSGAEIEQAVLSALVEAYADGVALDTQRLLGVLENSPPLSVTMREKIEELRAWSRGRCVPAD